MILRDARTSFAGIQVGAGRVRPVLELAAWRSSVRANAVMGASVGRERQPAVRSVIMKPV